MKSWESVDSKNGINFYYRTIFDHLAATFVTAVRRRRRLRRTPPEKATRPGRRPAEILAVFENFIK